jgi:tRNA threonylcarbamoyladenosine biosynthesis protein TsaB
LTRLTLVIDTATRQGVVGLAHSDGRLAGSETWSTGHRHGEEILSRLDALLAQAGAQARDIGAVAVGIGPGSFTGLRIGLATAKTLAYGLNVPLVGIPTAHALALAAAAGAEGEYAVTLPSGAHDRYMSLVRVAGDEVTDMQPAALTTPDTPAPAEAALVAVDLEAADVPVEALDLGHRALEGLAGAMARLAARALASGRTDDVAALVPAYVALPRGLTEIAGNVEWSPDLR